MGLLPVLLVAKYKPDSVRVGHTYATEALPLHLENAAEVTALDLNVG